MVDKKIKQKNIFLIGANKNNFFDLTVLSFNKIISSECVVLSKNFNKNFISELKKICSVIIYEEDICLKSKKKLLWNKILPLFQKYKKISHLKSYDPLFLNDGIEEYEFFKTNKITANIFSGIIEIIELLNSLEIPMTDRRINSSVEFIIINKKSDFIKKKFTLQEKVIIKISTSKLLLQLLGSNKINSENYKTNIILPNKDKEFYYKKLKEYKFLKKAIFTPTDNIFILIEKNEKI